LNIHPNIIMDLLGVRLTQLVLHADANKILHYGGRRAMRDGDWVTR